MIFVRRSPDVMTMFLRSGLAALTAAALIFCTPLVAVAEDDDPIECTIVDTSPDAIVIGVTPKRAYFDVGTDCDEEETVNWLISSDIYRGSTGASWLLLRNYHSPQSDKFDFTESATGRFTIDPVRMDMSGQGKGNVWLGRHPLQAAAFYDADRDGLIDSNEPVDSETSWFTILQATSFGSSFNASPEPRRNGQTISISASLKRADWNKAQYVKFGAWVMLQFRVAGAEEYKNVKWVWDNGVGAKTTVKATKTGTWRYRFYGDATRGPSNSKGDNVIVRR